MQRRSIVDRAIARSAYPDPPPSPAIRRRDANQPVATRIADIEREADAVANERPPVAIETAPEPAAIEATPAAIDETRSAEAATEATAAKAAAEPTATEATAEPTATETAAAEAAAAKPAAAESAAAAEAAAAMAARERKGIAGDRGDGKRRRERQCGYCFTDHGHFLCLSPQGERMLFCG